MNKYLIIALVTLLSGCANVMAPTVVQRIDFPAHEYEALEKEGTGKVSGQVFLKTKGGDVKYGAGSKVWLNPKTSYSDQWYSIQQQNNFKVYGYGLKTLSEPSSAESAKVFEFIKETQADGFGNFSFSDVPQGTYYLTSGVTWEAPGGALQGGFIVQIINVKNNQETTIMLTR
ncbi:hypothetical protein EXA18_06195 [Vibrio cincinnatiensis]|uniref:hypothetical protein n=1 Tax=Vibrio cincinnatiensis TaxID=675 RepID=UPI001EDD9DEE|nr:hypothetical protein [Vibrio cincinnatiensis]MCG3743078.1 hypothetical protein [Vibrio cincinnatiensis]